MIHSKLVPRTLRAFCAFLCLVCALLPKMANGAEIYINEVMASNSTNAPMVDFPDYFPDYVELYNASGRDIDLGAEAWSITTKNNPTFPSLPGFNFQDLYRFETGLVLPAESYLLLFLDSDTNFPGLRTSFTLDGTNVNFTLKRTGDQVKLYQGINLIDSLAFGPQITDLSIGRVPDAGNQAPTNDNFTLNVPTPYGAPGDTNTVYRSNTAAAFVPAPSSSNELSLKINEWVAFSLSNGKTNDDWLEIYNPDTNIIQLSGLWLVDRDREFTKPRNQIKSHAYIAPLGWVQYFADGKGDAQDAVDFSLSSTSGDDILIFAADQTTIIDRVVFAALPDANVSRGRVPDGGETIIRLQNQSPEDSNFGTIPEVAISEVLTHTDPPLEDAIELVNLTGNTVNIGNWWLSNSRSNGRKYRIPASSPKAVLPAGGYVVFYESEFNDPTKALQPFTLNSANGDECYLFKGDSAGRLTGFRRGISFGPAANGVSFIRHTVSNDYDTNVDVVASTTLTLGSGVLPTDPPSYANLFRSGTGAANAQPKVGPIVINEVYYHPPEIPVVGLPPADDTITEFVEFYNSSESTVLLYDPLQYFATDNNNPRPDGTTVLNGQRYADGRTNTWRVRGGISFNFPTNSSLGAGEFALLVNFSPTNSGFLQNFTNTFPSLASNYPSRVKLYGPYSGKLSNKGADIELRRPDFPQGPLRPDFRLVPYITVDLVKYKDAAPWPVTEVPVTGEGAFASLQKTIAYDYGNDPLGWFGGVPTPGNFNSLSGQEPPSIAIQPQSVTTFAGRTVTFSVTARGTGPLHYQWKNYDIPLPDATNRTLVIQNVSTNADYALRVVITNIADQIESQEVTLTVNPPLADAIRPIVKITSPTYATTTNLADLVTGTATDKNGINSVFYSINGGQFIAVTPSATYATWVTPVPVAFEQGTNTVSVYAIDQAANYSLTNTRTYFRSSRTALTLATTGAGTIKGATSGQSLELGRNFLLTAVPAVGSVLSNWVVTTNLGVALESGASTLSYKLASNMVVTANFIPNPFVPVRGKYTGLFYDSVNGVQHGSSGSFLLTTTDRGTYTASLLTGGRKLSASGQLSAGGLASNEIIRKGTNALAVDWNVALDGSDTVTGTVSEGSSWLATLTGDRAIFTKTNPCVLAGKYTFLLPGLPGDAFVPGGTSYGTLSIDSNGVASLKALLADKTTASLKVPISKNGDWPLYIPLYSAKGSLFSWINFEDRVNDDFHGNLNWSKPPLPPSKYYTNGFSTMSTNEAVGARYIAPLTTNKVLQMTSAVLTLDGGNLATGYTNTFDLGLSSKVTNTSPSTLKLAFTTSSGLFKGSLTLTNTGSKAIPFAGVVLQKGTNAAGYFLGTNQSGAVKIQ